MSLRFCAALIHLQTQSDLALHILLIAYTALQQHRGEKRAEGTSPLFSCPVAQTWLYQRLGVLASPSPASLTHQPEHVGGANILQSRNYGSSSDSKMGSQRGISGGGREQSEMCTVTAGKTTSK